MTNQTAPPPPRAASPAAHDPRGDAVPASQVKAFPAQPSRAPRGTVATRPPAIGQYDEAARVRLGAAADTAPDLLDALASDPSVTVRAAVAMNPGAPAHAHQLLATDSDERVRTLLAQRLASLIPALARDEREAVEAHALTMLTKLVEDEAVRVRAAIADVVKDMPDAPRQLILRLAYDSALPVAEPVIRLSPLLTAEDLLGLLAHAPARGVERAIASRPGLPSSVSDALARSTGSDVIGALLDNPSAAIREATLDALIARAASHSEWHERLVRRPALSARAARALSEIVTTQLLVTLASRGDLDPEVTLDLRRRLAAHQQRAEAAQSATDAPRLEEAMAIAHELADADRLDEAAVSAAARRGEARLCTAMLAVAADVPLSMVERAVTLRSAKGLVSLIWKAGFSMQIAGPLQVLLCRIGPDAVLRALDRGNFPLAVEEMRWQLKFLERVGR